MYLDINDVEQLNTEFCSIVGIKPIKALLVNDETGEVRSYITDNCLYKKPKGWENARVIVFENARFPDFTEEDNFCTLLKIQWELFGNIGEQCIRIKDESLPVNYLYNKTKALQILKSYGGSDMLNEYIRRVQNSEFSFNLEEDEWI